MPRVARNRQEIEEIKDNILDHALDSIINEGFDSFTMRKLGARVGCAAKTIYNYYESKDEIYLRILIKGFEKLNAIADEAIEGVSDPRARLRILGDVYLSFGLEHSHYYHVMFSTDSPKYLSYIGTGFESMAREERDIAMHFARIAEAVVAEILGKDIARDNDEISFQVVRMWSTLHGYVALHNSRSMPEYQSDTLVYRDRILDEMIAGFAAGPTGSLSQ